MSTEIKPGMHSADRSEEERKEAFSLSDDELEEIVDSLSLSISIQSK